VLHTLEFDDNDNVLGSEAVKGAVYRRIDGSLALPQLPFFRRHYGTYVKKPIDTNLHDQRDCETDEYTGRTYERGKMIWMIKKGNFVEERRIEELVIPYSEDFSR
jgi:hypothetical protein